MTYLTTVKGSDAFLDTSDPNTWNITVRLERHHKYSVQEAASDLQLYEFRDWNAKSTALGLREGLLDDDGGEHFAKAIGETDQWSGDRLKSKLSALVSLPFRVLTKDGMKPLPRSNTDDRASFICLSYRWWSDWIDSKSGPGFPLSPALRVDSYHGNHDIPEQNFPISDCMWNALLAERNSEAEGIWVDQLCLMQDDLTEVHSAVSSMNVLYASARKVIIVMENVILWSDEVRPMIKHAQQINSVPIEARKTWRSWTNTADPLVLGASACGLFKIEGSSWFRRIWCNHELLTGREFTFMIPVMEREPSEGGIDSVSVLKLDAKALATFIEASRYLMQTRRDCSTLLWRGWWDNIQEDKDVGIEPRVFYGFNAATNFSKKVDTPERTLLFKAQNYSISDRSGIARLRDALSFHEAQPRDILAVVLNTTHQTLAYQGPDPTIPEIVWLVNVAALARGDVSPLLTSCRLQQWRSQGIAGMPFQRYSWAAWPEQNGLALDDVLGEGLKLKYEILDNGLKLVVAATCSTNNIHQMQELPDSLNPLRDWLATLLKFHKYVESERYKVRREPSDEAKDSKATERKAKDRLDVHPKFLEHCYHAFFCLMALKPDMQDKIAKEFSSMCGLSDIINISAGVDTILDMPEDFASFEADLETENFVRIRELYQPIQPLILLIDKIVTRLIAPEYTFRSTDDHDDDLYVSVINGYNQVGDEWAVLAGLPSKKKHGFYWLVQPDTLVEASNPLVQEDAGIQVDFRFGGTWAVQAEDLDEEKSKSVEIWNETGNQEGEFYKELEQDAVKMKLLSRNIRMLTREPWWRPLYTKTVIVHA